VTQPSHNYAVSGRFPRLATTMRRVLITTATATAVLGFAMVPAHATWSIAGADPDTGEVGVAVASCVPFEVVVVPVVAPGEGAGASQAQLNGASGEPMLAAFDSGASAQDIIAAVTDPTFDPNYEVRQFGAVTLSGTAAGFTGTQTEPVAMNQANATNTASAQGNILVSDAVVTDSLAAFDATTGSLSDKLMAALEAGSAAGGDSRCGSRTASSAALIVAQPGDPSWQSTATTRVDPGPDERPSTYLSVVPGGRSNPVTDLRAMYDTAVPVDGKVYDRQVPFLLDTFGIPPIFVYILAGLLFALIAFTVLIVWAVRRRSKRRAAGSS
jgi:uncharacterized Ntn-hydrolase superfamily protein